MKPPIDQAIRDDASQDLKTSFFLEAGAGTGKTRILVNRVIRIISTGAALVQEIVVITFTEKAAGELRSRIREELHKGISSAEEDERTRFRAALRSLNSAHIETIHAFASSILREQPLEPAVDPNFQQLDEMGNELDFEERWRDWIWSIEGADLAAVERCLILGMDLATVRDVAHILDRLRELSLSAMRARAPDPDEMLRDLQATLRDCEALTGYAKPDDNCVKSYDSLREQLDAAVGLQGGALERALRAVRFKPARNKTKWTPPERRDDMHLLLIRAQDKLPSVPAGAQRRGAWQACAGAHWFRTRCGALPKARRQAQLRGSADRSARARRRARGGAAGAPTAAQVHLGGRVSGH